LNPLEPHQALVSPLPLPKSMAPFRSAERPSFVKTTCVVSLSKGHEDEGGGLCRPGFARSDTILENTD
jgi:hypothetical protein